MPTKCVQFTSLMIVDVVVIGAVPSTLSPVVVLTERNLIVKNALRILVMVLMIALISSCDSKPPITSGDVVNREFEPAHWEGGYESYCGYDYGYNAVAGKFEWHYSCNHSRWEDEHRWENDSWRIQIDGCVEYEDDGELKQHCDTRWIDVSERDYDRFTIGTHYPNPA